MENVTLGQITGALVVGIPIITALWFLFKIYIKILQNEKLTIASLKAVSVMLDHFIENKIGNGEFKKVREQIDDVLFDKKVGCKNNGYIINSDYCNSSNSCNRNVILFD